METWITIAAVVSAGAGAVAASAAVWLGWQNRQLVRASQEQVESQWRPVLVPVGKPVFQDDHDNWLKWGENEQSLQLRNVGSGTAYNVASVLYGCATYLHDSPAGLMRDATAADQHWTCWLGVPVVAGGREVALYKLGNGIFSQGNKQIGEYGFNAPGEPDSVALVQGALWRIARVVTTYHDITGRKEASIFDYVHNRGWHKVEILRGIDRDLHDLDGFAHPPVAPPAPV